MKRFATALAIVLAAAVGALYLTSGAKPEALMVTPAIYQSGGLDPLAHLEAPERTPDVDVFYATNRAREGEGGPVRYGNDPTTSLSLGRARVRFGDDVSWTQLHQASRQDPRERPILLELEAVQELPEPAFYGAVNAELARDGDAEVLLYVHGAKVDFYNACVFSAELDHFTGRDMVSIAYAWPTHQNVLTYVSGEDIERGAQSATLLTDFLRALARRTSARKINIISWSAGGPVVARALDALGEPGEPAPDATRIGTVIFAAPDSPVDELMKELPNIHRVAERVVVTASDDDVALRSAADVIGGGQRAGSIGDDLPADEAATVERLQRIELVDVSYGKEQRGFDITGHYYWFRHAWVASDVILALRTRLPAGQRGLEASPIPHVWYLPGDYPERARAAATAALGSTWQRRPRQDQP
jgi:esterase/lipase superfamily enzyme